MIASLAARICAQRAISGATLAGGRVHDSEIRPIDEALRDEPQPFIVLATEDENATITGLDVTGGDRRLDLYVEIGVGSMVRIEQDDVEAVTIPHTDAGLELSINLISRQVIAALFVGGGAWGDLFRTIVPEVQRIYTRRGAGSENGVRFAARQIVIECKPIFEPTFGIEPDAGTPWARFIALMQADAELSPIAEAVHAALVGSPIPDWRAIGTMIGLSEAAQRGIGIGPLSDEPEEPAQLEEVEFGGGFSITQE